VNMQLASRAHLAEEVPVALVFNGISHAVMMATPLHLEDFALGFALSEGLIDQASQLYGVEVIQQAQGIELQIDIAAQCEVRLKERKRSMAGRTGCGLCGTDSLDQVKLKLSQAPKVQLDVQAMQRAHAGLRALQGKLRNTQTLLEWMILTLERRRRGHVFLEEKNDAR
jgi:FdhD protein